MASTLVLRSLTVPKASRFRLQRPLSHPVKPLRATHQCAGINLEVFKFGLYILFPIGWMYYFGTNLSDRFDIPEFWPQPGETNKIPFEKEEMLQLKSILRERRLENKRRRLKQDGGAEELESGAMAACGGLVDGVAGKERYFGKGAIDRWARGE